jgi:hypothetical protein
MTIDKNNFIDLAVTSGMLDDIEIPDYDNETLALAEHLEEDPSEISHDGYSTYSFGNASYLVLDDCTADSEAEERMKSYLDDCIYYRIPGELQIYFDEERWMLDALMDGRGSWISSYDGHENYEIIEGETYYIYRVH